MAELTTRLTISARAQQALAELAKVTGGFAGLGRSGEKAGGDINRGMGVARRGVASISEQLQRARRDLLGFFAAQLSARAASALGRSVFETAASFEQFGNAMKAVTGSAAAGQRELAFVREEAERLKLPLEEATRQFVQLTAAANGTSLEGDGIRQIFSALSEASVVLGLNTEQLTRAFTAIQQMISKGTVSAEELRGQLGEALPGAFQIAARSIGVTTEKLSELLQQGALSSDTFVIAFAKQLQREYSSGVPDALNSSRAALADFQNAVTDLKLAIADSGFMDGLTDAFKELATTLRDPQVVSSMRIIGKSLGDLIRLAARHATDIDRLVGLIAGFSAGGKIGDTAAAFARHPLLQLLLRLGGRAGGAAIGAFALDDLIEVSPETVTRIDRVRGAIRQLQDGIQALRDQVAAGKVDPAAAAAAIAANEAEIKRLRKELPRTKAGRPSVPPTPVLLPEDEEKKQKKSTRKSEAEIRAEQLKALVDSAREEAETLGFTARQLAQYEAARLGATEAEKAAIDQSFDRIEAHERQQKVLEQERDAAEERTRLLEEEAEAWAQRDAEMEQAAETVRQTIDPFRALNQELQLVRELFARGKLSVEEFNAAVAEINGRIQETKDELAKAGNATNEFAIQAARNIQSAFADFLFDPFEGGLKGMLDGFEQTLRRMAAEAVAAQLGKKLFGDFGKTDEIGGIAGKAVEFLAGFFHTGGVVGDHGPSRRIPALAFAGAPRLHSGGVLGLAPDEIPIIAQRGEEVLRADDPRHRNNGGGGMNVVFNVNATDADSFRRSKSQVEAMLRQATERGMRNL